MSAYNLLILARITHHNLDCQLNDLMLSQCHFLLSLVAFIDADGAVRTLIHRFYIHLRSFTYNQVFFFDESFHQERDFLFVREQVNSGIFNREK